MKIKCCGCDRGEASVFCCADEAALCLGCDQKIHEADKFVSKHQRVSLSSGSCISRRKCDICQETIGFFLCREHRALLCRKCDVSIHSINSFVSAHQRFLFAGVKIGLESGEPYDKILGKSACSDYVAAQVAASEKHGTLMAERIVLEENSTMIGSQTNNIQCSMDKDPSNQEGTLEVGENVHGSSEWWRILRSIEEELMNDEWIGILDDAFWRYSSKVSTGGLDIKYLIP